MRYIVTTGYRFTDIDGYACCIAYADLLRKEGKDAVAILPGVLNESVIPEVKAWGGAFETEYSEQPEDNFVLQDISEKEYFAQFVKEDNVFAVYDHHFGFEKYWQEKLGNNAHIEKMGACATFIVEEAVQKNLLTSLELSSLRLLYTAIFANSLNLKASVTTERDIKALELLSSLVNLDQSWHETYFESLQQGILNDPISAVKRDLKILEVEGESWAIGQLELWNGAEIFQQYQADFQKLLGECEQKYAFITIPSIKQGLTFVQAKNMKTREILEQFGLTGNKLQALRLRKEWIKLLMSSPS